MLTRGMVVQGGWEAKVQVEIQERVPLASRTTMKVGGDARFFISPKTEAQLQDGIGWAREHHLPVVAIGGGSNLLVSDDGFPGLVLAVELEPSIHVEAEGDHVQYTVSSGVSWEDLVDRVCRDGFSGIECLAGIPGLTGATPVQNVGAYGQEVAQSIRSVRAWDRLLGHFVHLSAAECHFGYRRSRFQTPGGGAAGRFLITAVTFAFRRNVRPEWTYAELRHAVAEKGASSPSEVAAVVRAIRRRKGMVVVPGDPDSRSAGSFFKNPIVGTEQLSAVARAAGVAEAEVPFWPASAASGPTSSPDSLVKLPAAWLVERAGFPKGYRLGPAAVSSRHSLALTNHTGGATCADILRLRDTIRSGVYDRFVVLLEQEPLELSPTTHDSWALA